MSTVDDALRLSQLGWSVFPGMLTDDVPPKKVPIGELVEHGFKEATTHAKRIALWWRVRPDAYIGVAMPPNTVALDVDDVGVFDRLGLELLDGPGQQTPRGGYHRFFKTDGRYVKQSVKTEFPGADTRVGGRGYVFAWQPDEFPDVADLPFAPEWMYGVEPEASVEYDGGPSPAMDALETGELFVEAGGRDNTLASLAGSLAARGSPWSAVELALNLIVAAGGVEQPLGDPITKQDIRRISRSVTATEESKKKSSTRRKVDRHYAVDLLAKQLRPLEYLVAEILPEGLGVVAGAPKVGKSWLTFQAAVELAIGGRLLGRPIDAARPVLYYGLEDGERRFQKRLMDLIGGRDIDLRLLELRYEAPAISEGLEDDICKWLDDNDGGCVFVDVLAKVRPVSKGKGNAYDEDYAVIGPLQTITKDRPGSALVVVTHDRKAGSEDFLTTVTGTRGITGAADWIWVIKRDRLAIKGTIFVTGRDIERDSAIEANFTGNWTALPGHTHAKSFEQDLVLDSLRTAPDGNATAKEMALYLNPDYAPTSDAKLDPERQSASDKLNSLVDQGLVQKVGRRPGRAGEIIFHAISDKERADMVKRIKEESRAVMPSNGALEVRRSSRVIDGVTVVTPRRGANHAPAARDDLEGVTTDDEGVTAETGQVSHPRDDEGRGRAPAREVPSGNHAGAPARERPSPTVTPVTPSFDGGEGVTGVTGPRSLPRAHARGRAPAHVPVRPVDYEGES